MRKFGIVRVKLENNNNNTKDNEKNVQTVYLLKTIKTDFLTIFLFAGRNHLSCALVSLVTSFFFFIIGLYIHNYT